MDDLTHALIFIALAGPVFFAVMFAERAWLIHHGRPQAYQLNESLANIGTGLIYKLVDAVLLIFVASAIYLVVQQQGLQWQSDWPWLNFLLLMVLVDFSFYWVHRFMHKVRYGWTGHWVHHSSERFNFSTALRQTPVVSFNGIITVAMLPAALVGFELKHAVIALELNLFFQFFVHTETVRRMPRWFEWVFNTPGHHRVHHGSNPKQIDTNFAGVLIIWDRLFGTFVDEKDAGEIKYGVDFRPATTLNPFKLVVAEFISMWRDVWHYRDLRIVWKHPSWVEEYYGREQSTTSVPETKNAL